MAPVEKNPNARERAPGFPPQVAPTPVPTALALYHQIPPAVQFNLHRMITEGIRYEENAYGYFNSVLISIFSPTQQFQINPQYPARPAVDVGEGTHGQNISISSTRQIDAARGTGREKMNYPDFTLTKLLPRQPPTPQIHCNIGVVVIKTLKSSMSRSVTSQFWVPWNKQLSMPTASPPLSRYKNKILNPLPLMWFMASTTRESTWYIKESYRLLKQSLGSLYLRTLHLLRVVHRFYIDYVSLLSATGTTMDSRR